MAATKENSEIHNYRVSPHRHCIVQHRDEVIREWKIEDKLFAQSLDNTSNNGAMIKLLKTHLLNKKMIFCGGRPLGQHCAAYVINLICQAGLNYLSPKISKICDTVKYIQSSHTILGTMEPLHT